MCIVACLPPGIFEATQLGRAVTAPAHGYAAAKGTESLDNTRSVRGRTRFGLELQLLVRIGMIDGSHHQPAWNPSADVKSSLLVAANHFKTRLFDKELCSISFYVSFVASNSLSDLQRFSLSLPDHASTGVSTHLLCL
jgi:hypothetical protein